LITGMKTYTIGTGHHRSAYPVPSFVKGFPMHLKNVGYYCTNNEKTDYNIANAKALTAEAWDESSSKAGWWNKRADQPFFAVFNINSSHQSRTMTESYQYYQNNVLKQLPENLQVSEDELIMPPFYRDSPEMRKYTARIYNSIALADYEMRQLFERLKSEKLLENTIIFCFADHGEGMPRVKTNGIAIGNQVPFFIVIPEKFKKDFPFEAGTTNDQLIDFCDLAPTVLDIANAEIPEHFQGKSILKHQHKQLFISTDRADESNDLVRTIIKGNYAYSRSFMPFMPELRYLAYIDKGDITKQIRKDFLDAQLNQAQSKMLLTRPVDYLYDYINDPWQLNNLALDKKFEGLLKECKIELRNHLIENRDVMFLPESEFDEISKTSTLYEFRKSESNYPIKKIMDAAMLSGFRSKSSCKKQIKLLNDHDQTVQFWAAIGLKSQDKKIIKHQQKNLKKIWATKTIDHASKVILASVINEKLGDIDGKKYLEQTILGNDADLSWLALQSILYQQNRSDFDSIASRFLEKSGTQKGWDNAITSAAMLLDVIKKHSLKSPNE
ncbi:MAG: sulfatase-like hydrolase/transferase, partial [Saprospiraceae bacterium]